jgi:iron complex outermembrane receptor protein
LLGFVLSSAAVASLPASSSELDDAHADGLADLSIEELMNESVTSVSKKSQKFGDAAAAIAVLSNDDLRRSGATSVAEALRMVPGLQVAALNSSKWAISARGFNNVYANKLLVLVDGRAVYSSVFAGVYWELQQMLLEDIDRIEIIRGPGATVWGANAVNGVINIVSRTATDTQGGFFYGGGGDVQEIAVGARYGARMGDDTYYRVFSSYQENADFPTSSGGSANDRWEAMQGGFRVDHYPQVGTQLTWQAQGAHTDMQAGEAEAYNLNTLGRWTRILSERSTAEVQTYYDRSYRHESGLVGRIETFDATVQHTFGMGARNDAIWGLGYRRVGHEIHSRGGIAQIRDTDFGLQLFSGFVQNEVQLIPQRLTLTAGVKIEHNDYTDFEFQPSIRAAFKPTRDQTLWAALSRAVRTPDVLEGRDVFAISYGAPFQAPGGLYVPTLVGDEDVRSEVLRAHELGYRAQVSPRLNIDVATFYNDYSRLIHYGSVRRLIPGTPVGMAEIPWANVLDGETYGGEVVVTASPIDAWRVSSTYSLLIPQLHGSEDAKTTTVQNGSPRHQAALRLAHDHASGVSLDAQLRYVSSIFAVSSYLTADLRVTHALTESLQLTFVGQNLLQPQHTEQAPIHSSISADVPRGFYLKLTGRF